MIEWRWEEIEQEAPELAAAARRYFDAHVHMAPATLSRDGSPRISGIEATFADGDLWLGMTWRSVEAPDVRRDRRFALHSGSDDPSVWTGDVKVAGVLEEANEGIPAAVLEGPPSGARLPSRHPRARRRPPVRGARPARDRALARRARSRARRAVGGRGTVRPMRGQGYAAWSRAVAGGRPRARVRRGPR